MTDLFIITGISEGIGKSLYKKLSLSNVVIGTTSKKNLEDLSKKIVFLNLGADKLDTKNLLKIIYKINFSRVFFFYNAVTYDNIENKDNLLKINYYNQKYLFDSIKFEFKDKKYYKIFFSSFEVFNKQSIMPNYKFSKELFIKEFFEEKEKNYNITYKLFILGGIRTNTYLKNKKLSLIRKLITASTSNAAKFIISKTMTEKNDIFYFPKIYKLIFRNNSISSLNL